MAAIIETIKHRIKPAETQVVTKANKLLQVPRKQLLQIAIYED